MGNFLNTGLGTDTGRHDVLSARDRVMGGARVSGAGRWIRGAGLGLSALIAGLATALATGVPLVAQEAAPAVEAAVAGEPPPSDPWAMVCQALGPGATACGLIQRQTLEGGGVLLVLELAGLEPDRTPLLVVTTPLGTRLRDGVVLTVDGTDLARLSFEVCRQTGCVAQVSGSEVLERLRAGAAMGVRFMLETGTGEGQEIALSAPLAGIARGVDRVWGVN